MSSKRIRKIIYFDRETIRNILQEQHQGDYSKTIEKRSSFQSGGEIESSAQIKLNIPVLSRIYFLFSGKLSASYLIKRDGSTTITSTELSEFTKLKSQLIELKGVQIYDIENSSTSLRVAGGYMRIIKGGIDGVDTNEFNAVMNNYDGYDTYRINDSQYVRFNNSAFLSNYKRNDLMTTVLTLYCIPVGKFERKRFDYQNEILKMNRLFSQTDESGRKIADVYPPRQDLKTSTNTDNQNSENDNSIELFDVVYACIDAEVTNV